MTEVIWDFGWGNPYFLLDILDEQYCQKLVPFNIKKMSYGPDRGLEKLVKLTHSTIQETMGLEYEHIIMTTGATQAINIVLRVMNDNKKTKQYNTVLTSKYGFPYYEDMIKKAGYNRIQNDLRSGQFVNCIKLIDSPSNPMGKQYGQDCGNEFNTIWDSVYHNSIYTNNLSITPKHYVMVGSYSKLLGITGARIGFIATNHPMLARKCSHECLIENATISIPSQELVIDIMDKIDLHHFMASGKNSLNRNKEEFRRIEYLFDNQPVPEVGMFYCLQADKKSLQVLKKCGIKYVDLGDSFIRLSLGQTNKMTSECINMILKKDGK